ncbi:MAG: phosphatase PAP2 family protein [Prevotella sp.]|nr:phosphatase PAP2 family protein [Prevotella sp.]
MKKYLNMFFSLEKSPRKGFLAYEWATLTYLVLTLAYVLVMYSYLPNSQSMISGRIHIAAITIAMWGVYRMVPCGLTLTLRALVQAAFLSRWYPDIFELNRVLPNLDHVFATWEQAIFGCQPALLFPQVMNNAVVSELMCLGYTCYYPLIATVLVTILLFRNESFERVVFVTLASFYIHYIIFVALPVTGPQYYFQAVGLDEIAKGIFPNLHDYFNHNQVRMACPGYSDGLFYSWVDIAHDAGERPVAAFPSSHVGLTVVVMLVLLQYRLKRLFWVLLPFAVLLFLSTVYIRAHYAIDAIAGLLSGALCFAVLTWVSSPRGTDKKFSTFSKSTSRKRSKT